MKHLLPIVLLLAAGVASAIDPERLEDPVQQERYNALIHELRCLKCQGETVADTPAMFAVDIRRQVRTLVSEGRSDEEVKQYLVDRYGEMILLKPRSAWLWIAPVIFLLGGALIAWRILGQRRELLASDDSDPEDQGGQA
jgi:cytochrome c-type biogenesis protein CcmH